jgi:hypothetical protein
MKCQVHIYKEATHSRDNWIVGGKRVPICEECAKEYRSNEISNRLNIRKLSPNQLLNSERKKAD